MVIVSNKEINYKYEIIDRIECGIELKGTEVKSIRKSMCNLKDSFALITSNLEVILKNMHISHYELGNINNVKEKRDRRLLLHKSEILKLSSKLKQSGYTLVPSKVYTVKNNVKIELCICKGRKIYDNREKIKQSEVKRQINEYKKI